MRKRAYIPRLRTSKIIHNDGHIAVVLAAPPGIQVMLIEGSPRKFYKPPYVGGRGWVGIELDYDHSL